MGVNAKFIPARSLRNTVNRMRDKAAALELVLLAYEEVSGTEEEGEEAARRLGLGPVQGLMFTLMERNMGKLVSLNALSRVQESIHLNSEGVTSRTTRVQICKMRRTLRTKYTITNVFAKGYILKPCVPKDPQND